MITGAFSTFGVHEENLLSSDGDLGSSTSDVVRDYESDGRTRFPDDAQIFTPTVTLMASNCSAALDTQCVSGWAFSVKVVHTDRPDACTDMSGRIRDAQ